MTNAVTRFSVNGTHSVPIPMFPFCKLPLQRDISQNCKAALGQCPDECSDETLSALISFLSTLSQTRGAATYVRSRRDLLPISRRE